MSIKKDIYEKHQAAFAHISAGALVMNGKLVGNLAFKFPKDGAGRLTCYLHLFGYPMVAGTASGYGYDKKSAALESACRLLDDECLAEFPSLVKFDTKEYSFQRALEVAGFDYYRAI